MKYRMSKFGKKERELMDHLESVISRYAFSRETQNTDVCRKPELRILEILGKRGPLMMTDIADRAGLSLSAVTAIMDGLVEKDLVSRERSRDDRRVVRVELTNEGQVVFQEIEEFHLRIVRGMLSSLNLEEQDKLIGLFRKMSEKIEKEKSTTVH